MLATERFVVEIDDIAREQVNYVVILSASMHIMLISFFAITLHH